MNHRTLTDAELRAFVRRRALTPHGDVLDHSLRETEVMGQTRVRFALLPPAAAIVIAAALLFGAVLILRPPSRDPGVSPSPTEHACADRPPEVDGEVVDPVTVTDGTGLVVACRLIGSDEAQVVGALSTVAAVNPNAVDTRLQVFWVEANCDQAARIEVIRERDASAITVLQQRDGPCMGGTGLQAIELELSGPVPAASVVSTIIHSTQTACALKEVTSSSGAQVTVIDGSGLVRSCRVMDPPRNGLSLPAANNRGGAETRLEVAWALEGCDTGDATVEVARNNGRHAITIRPERATECRGSGAQRIQLNLSGPMEESTVDVKMADR